MLFEKLFYIFFLFIFVPCTLEKIEAMEGSTKRKPFLVTFLPLFSHYLSFHCSKAHPYDYQVYVLLYAGKLGHFGHNTIIHIYEIPSTAWALPYKSNI